MNEEYDVKTIVVAVKSSNGCYGCIFLTYTLDSTEHSADPCNLCGDNIFVKRYELVRIK